MTTQLLHDECELTMDAASSPLPREALWVLDWISLRASAVYRGEGVPRGRGEAVIVVPGFLGSYTRLHELTDWLGRVSYHVFGPGFERNIECPDVLLERLENQIAAVSTSEGRSVRLIGHSLGGSLARAAAIRMPERVAQVITLGSPLRSVRAHPLVVELARLLAVITPSRHDAHADHLHGATCACELADALTQPFPASVSRKAIYSRRDGVVDWHTNVDGDAAVDVEVNSTHVGMVVNAAAYRAIAHALAGLDAHPAVTDVPAMTGVGT